MRPKSVFLPYELKNGLETRVYDLPLFSDIDPLRRFMFDPDGGGQKLAPRKITYSEHFDESAIDEYMARRRPS